MFTQLNRRGWGKRRREREERRRKRRRQAQKRDRERVAMGKGIKTGERKRRKGVDSHQMYGVYMNRYFCSSASYQKGETSLLAQGP